MELPLAFQGSQFLLAALLGAVYGLVYDLFRGLRRTAHGLTPVLDFLICLVFLCGNLLFALYIGLGEYRIFMAVASAMGAALYFLTLGRLFLPVFCTFWRLFFLPFRKICYFLCKIFKKMQKYRKNLFSFHEKSVKIKGQRKMKPRKNRQEG